MPFDWQAHDTYFIVAHLHYVLIGGMVFPLFAGLYYWAPLSDGQAGCRSGCGTAALGLMFARLQPRPSSRCTSAGLMGSAAAHLHLSGGGGMGLDLWN